MRILRPQRYLLLPGGRAEPGEEMRVALKRELFEEVAGMTFEIGRYLGKIGHIWKADGKADSGLHHFFEARIVEGSSARAKEQGRELRWLSLNGAEREKLKPPALLGLILRANVGEEWDVVERE